MPLRLPLLRRLRIVDDAYKPVPVVFNIKDDVAFYRISIFERSADPIKIVPANRLDNGGPGCNFVRCIWVGFHCLLQVLTRNDVHLSRGRHSEAIYLPCVSSRKVRAAA